MAKPKATNPEVLTYGAPGALILSDEVTTRLNGWDEGYLEILCPNRDTYTKGSPAPESPGLSIIEVSTRSECDEFIARLLVRGLRSESSRRIALDWQRNPFGWDQCNETRIAAHNAVFTEGTTLAGYSNMKLIDIGEAQCLDGKWAQYQLGYQGIRTNGLVKRETKVNENIVSPGSPVTVTLPLAGGWDEPSMATVSLPRVVVVDKVKSTTAPPLHVIPGPLGGAAGALNLPTVQTFSLTGDGLIRQWPNGWKWADISSEELYKGAGVWLITYTYEHVWEYSL